MLSGQTILVVEAEFLIALDIQRMLETLGAGQMLFARSADEAHELNAHWSALGLAIVEIRSDSSSASTLVNALRAEGISVILFSANGNLRNGHPDFPNVSVVIKPMSEDDLAMAIERTLTPKP